MNIIDHVKLLRYLWQSETIFLRRSSRALGDNLLLTVVARDVRRRFPDRPLVVETPFPEIFLHNPHVTFATAAHWKTTRRHLKPKYFLSADSYETHIADQLLARISGGTGDSGADPARRRPEMHFSAAESERWAKLEPKGAVVISPVGKQSHSADRKEWGFDRFQEVVRALPGVRFVQIGGPLDPLLEGVVDRRGLSIRGSAGVLSAGRLFTGLEGGLMHLAAAVGRPGVIVYGGAVHPASTGYPDHVALVRRPECSPCVTSHERMTPCPNALQCLTPIQPGEVVREIDRILTGELTINS